MREMETTPMIEVKSKLRSKCPLRTPGLFFSFLLFPFFFFATSHVVDVFPYQGQSSIYYRHLQRPPYLCGFLTSQTVSLF